MKSLFDEDQPAENKPARAQIAKVRYTHDSIIDMILVNPAVSQNDLAREFGFSVTWMSIVVNSDSFKERLAERKAELVDPKIRATLAEKVDAAASRALDRIMDRLDSSMHGSIKTQDLVSIAKLGAAPKTSAPSPTQNLFVVQLPPAAANSSDWLSSAQRTPRGPIQIIEESPRG